MDNKVSKGTLQQLRRSDLLSENAFEKSLQIAGLLPDQKKWQQFINYSSLFLGTALLLNGIIFFFAYNWEGLHKFAKLGITEAAVLICAIGAIYKGIDNIVGKVFLLAASVLVGAVLAVFGQVYQTGADPYELFLGWSALIAGWVVISRFGALWLIWLVLINLGLTLRYAQLYPYKFIQEPDLHILLFIINTGALAAWEVFSLKGWDWLKSRWIPALICLKIHITLCTRMIFVLFDERHAFFALIYIAFVGATFFFYLKKNKDLFMLTMNSMSLIFVITCVIIRMIGNNLDFGWFLLLSFIVIGQASVAGYWLRKVINSWKNS